MCRGVCVVVDGSSRAGGAEGARRQAPLVAGRLVAGGSLHRVGHPHAVHIKLLYRVPTRGPPGAAVGRPGRRCCLHGSRVCRLLRQAGCREDPARHHGLEKARTPAPHPALHAPVWEAARNNPDSGTPQGRRGLSPPRRHPHPLSRRPRHPPVLGLHVSDGVCDARHHPRHLPRRVL